MLKRLHATIWSPVPVTHGHCNPIPARLSDLHINIWHSLIRLEVYDYSPRGDAVLITRLHTLPGHTRDGVQFFNYYLKKNNNLRNLKNTHTQKPTLSFYMMFFRVLIIILNFFLLLLLLLLLLIIIIIIIIIIIFFFFFF